jgi:MFS family permease
MLIAHLFFVLALSQLLNIKRQEPAKAIIFWAGFFIGIGIVFAPIQAALILLPWLALIVFRPFVWREWFMVILGGLIPIIYLIAILYLTKGYVHFPEPVHTGFDVDKNIQLYEILNFSIFGLIVLGSVFNYWKVNNQEVNRFKKLTLVLIHFIWLSLISFAIGWYFYDLFYLGFLIPLSIIIGTQMLHSRSQTLINGIVIIWLIISVANVVLSQS